MTYYAVLASSLPMFQTMICVRFGIKERSFIDNSNQCTISDSSGNTHRYIFVGSWEDISKIVGEFKIVVVNPISSKPFHNKVVKEWAKRNKKSVNDVYKEIEQWHHPDSEEGIRLARLKIFKEIGS